MISTDLEGKAMEEARKETLDKIKNRTKYGMVANQIYFGYRMCGKQYYEKQRYNKCQKKK